MDRTQLDPWRVILHHLFGLDTREIPKILDLAGLAVDWALSEKQDYSNKTRLAAYRPRILQAYEALGGEDKLRVAYVVVQSLPDSATEELARDLQNVGWNIEGGRLVPGSAPVSELFFPTGTQHDAYVKIREILRGARQSITVVDAYVDGTIFGLLGSRQAPVDSVHILTFKYPNDFTLEASKFRQQYPKVNVELRKTKTFHDRFLVIDGAQCWHLGTSIKDAGMKAFMISQVEGEGNRAALLAQFEQSWQQAQSIEASSGGRQPNLDERKLLEEFERLRRQILHINLMNHYPAALNELRIFFINEGVVDRSNFRLFFERWLNSPAVAMAVPALNVFTVEQIHQMKDELRALEL